MCRIEQEVSRKGSKSLGALRALSRWVEPRLQQKPSLKFVAKSVHARTSLPAQLIEITNLAILFSDRIRPDCTSSAECTQLDNDKRQAPPTTYSKSSTISRDRCALYLKQPEKAYNFECARVTPAAKSILLPLARHGNSTFAFGQSTMMRQSRMLLVARASWKSRCLLCLAERQRRGRFKKKGGQSTSRIVGGGVYRALDVEHTLYLSSVWRN